jgi:Na+-translocating ferredoxin:NAD+ oxidoreductase RnfG subunit
MPETIMVAVDDAGRATRIQVLSFSEPEEFLPRPNWYEQFQGKPLSDELSMKRGIRPVTGATLTARATTDAARRVLALHQVLRRAAPSKSPSP